MSMIFFSSCPLILHELAKVFRFCWSSFLDESQTCHLNENLPLGKCPPINLEKLGYYGFVVFHIKFFIETFRKPLG